MHSNMFAGFAHSVLILRVHSLLSSVNVFFLFLVVRSCSTLSLRSFHDQRIALLVVVFIFFCGLHIGLDAVVCKNNCYSTRAPSAKGAKASNCIFEASLKRTAPVPTVWDDRCGSKLNNIGFKRAGHTCVLSAWFDHLPRNPKKDISTFLRAFLWLGISPLVYEASRTMKTSISHQQLPVIY